MVSAESVNQFELRYQYRTETKIVVSVVHYTYGMDTCGMDAYGMYTYRMYTYGMYAYGMYTYGNGMYTSVISKSVFRYRKVPFYP